MSLVLFAFLTALGVLLGMLLCMEVGRRIGLADVERDPQAIKQGFGAIDGAVFGLLGLLLAFTFSGAASRFDERWRLTAAEANEINKSYLRIDLLPDEAQPQMRELFRRYVDLRIETQQQTEDVAVLSANLERTTALQREIWAKELAGFRKLDVKVFVPALNGMLDMTTTQLTAAQTHPPKIVYLLLVSLSLVGSLLAGYDMARGKFRNWFHMLIFAGAMSLVVYVILDIEYPRLGLIRVDASDQVLIDLRKSMK